MPATAQRLSSFTESIIRDMTRVANHHGAINLSQGFPDDDPPPEVIAAAQKAMLEGPHQYAITWGAPNLRQALAEKQSRLMGRAIDADTDIVITCGSTEAMICAMMCTCDPGDKVIIFSPFYENYGADSILCGAEPIYVPLEPPEYSFDLKKLQEAFARKPKAIILCNPSNPSGKVFTLDELQIIAELACDNDCYVITDEVYEHIVYPPHSHHYMASLPGMFERTLSCSSLSKTYSMTGWRLGYIIAPAKITSGARQVHDFLTVGAAAPLQEAAVTALRLPASYYQQLTRSYTKRRDLFLGYLDEAGLSYTKPQGAYYVMVDFSGCGIEDDYAFCRWMAQHIGVAAVPGSSFFHEKVNHLVRFHFSKSEEILHECGKRLQKLPALL